MPLVPYGIIIIVINVFKERNLKKMNDREKRKSAKSFSKNWENRGYEKGDSQIFWAELLTTVFGVTEISQFISFEDQVHLDHTSIM